MEPQEIVVDGFTKESKIECVIRVVPSRMFLLRLRVARQLLVLAAWVLGVGIEVKEEDAASE